MSSAPRLVSDVRRDANRVWTWDDLSANERNVLLYCERAAREDRLLEGVEDMAFELKLEGTGAIRNIMVRLEAKGFIKNRCFQRGRQVYVASLDKWTKEPANTTPHWKHVYEQSKNNTPTLPRKRIEEASTVMAAVTRLMREKNISMPEAQIMLMSFGVAQVATLHVVG
jgi:hypothetical protein